MARHRDPGALRNPVPARPVRQPPGGPSAPHALLSSGPVLLSDLYPSAAGPREEGGLFPQGDSSNGTPTPRQEPPGPSRRLSNSLRRPRSPGFWAGAAWSRRHLIGGRLRGARGGGLPVGSLSRKNRSSAARRSQPARSYRLRRGSIAARVRSAARAKR